MMNHLLQPKKYKSLMADEGSRAIMNNTITFFEKMGKARILDDYTKKIWYREFVEFIGKEQIFAKLLTPKEYAGGDPIVGGTRPATVNMPNFCPSTAWATGTASR